MEIVGKYFTIMIKVFPRAAEMQMRKSAEYTQDSLSPAEH